MVYEIGLAGSLFRRAVTTDEAASGFHDDESSADDGDEYFEHAISSGSNRDDDCS